MVDVVFITPVIATVVATLTFLLVFWAFLGKPWKLKTWLLISQFFWIPWAGFTVLMRLAETEDEAIWWLRFSFISLQISLYGAYRFHHQLVFKPTDNRIETFGLAILMGFNVSLSFESGFLTAVETSGGYYTDKFDEVLMIPNILFGTWAAFWVFKALNEMDAFSLFYDAEGKRNTFTVFVFGSLILAAIASLIIWLVQDNPSDATPFIVIITIALLFFSRIYGLNAVSTIIAPQRIWSFMIINSSGVLVYEKEFSSDESLGEISLMSMAITASNATIMANLESETAVDEVSMEDRAILINKDVDLLFCLVADHRSVQLEILLNEASKRIIDHPKFSESKIGDSYGKYQYADNILNNIFASKTVDLERGRVSK